MTGMAAGKVMDDPGKIRFTPFGDSTFTQLPGIDWLCEPERAYAVLTILDKLSRSAR